MIKRLKKRLKEATRSKNAAHIIPGYIQHPTNSGAFIKVGPPSPHAEQAKQLLVHANELAETKKLLSEANNKIAEQESRLAAIESLVKGKENK